MSGPMNALHLHAGPAALAHIRRHGLAPSHVRTIAAAAGGPKGLILGALDRFLFGDWLAQSQQPVDLVGASIGAWRMATACLRDPVVAFDRFQDSYLHQHYEMPPGKKKVEAAEISRSFERRLAEFFQGHVEEVLHQPRYRLHLLTTHGRHLLAREQGWRTPLGYGGAFVSNLVQRRAMGAWLERVVFSTPGAALPFATRDYRTRQVALSPGNFLPALLASCSIPFVLQAVHHIPEAPAGAYWDGGIIDYHLHLDYAAALRARDAEQPGIVLYPHFQREVVPGWLDKALKWRHRATHFLDHMVLLCPNPDWVRTLPNGKLPDRTDFGRHGNDLAARVQVWRQAVQMSRQLADELQAWLERPDPSMIRPL